MKPKWKTTEFWVQVAAMAATVLGLVADKFPPVWGEVILAAQAGIYTWWRSASKRLATQAEMAKPVPGELLTLETARSAADEVRETLATQMEPLTKTIAKAAAEAAHEGAALAGEAIDKRVEDLTKTIRAKLERDSAKDN